MPTDKRQRQKEARQARLESERKAARRAAARKRLVTGVVIAAGVFAVLALISFVGGKDDDDGEAAGATTTTAPATTTTLAPRQEKPQVTVPPEPATTLEVTDLTEGEGEEAALGSRITVDYVGVSQSTGTEFDASYDGEPATFELTEGSLIQGWIDGIPGMRVGGRRQLVIPGDLGYGPTGNPPDIGPNETLVFVIDLLAVEPPPPTPTSAPSG